MRITTPRWTQGNGATRAVALEVLIHGPLSRSEVARRLDLSPGSLTRLSAPLLDSGLLIEVGEHSDGRVGRPSQLLDVVPASRRFIGMKLMADEVLGVTTDLRANVLATETRRLKAQDPAAVVAVIAGNAAVPFSIPHAAARRDAPHSHRDRLLAQPRSPAPAGDR